MTKLRVVWKIVKANPPRTSDLGRQRRASSEDVRLAILDAAAKEFAMHGFDGASTRAIAERAGVFQAQLGYHVGDKDALWVMTIDCLFDRLRLHLEEGISLASDEAPTDPVTLFSGIIRRHVEYTARHPELHRIMSIEAAQSTKRTKYLLNEHVRPIIAALRLLWADVRASGRGGDRTAEEVFMLMIAMAPLPFAQSALMKPLLGSELCDPIRHAGTIEKWILV